MASLSYERNKNPRDWINGDESAKDFLSRVLTKRPHLLLPPLHRIPLRVGNVVEIVGPSPSAKSEILLQAAINCILPKKWKGVYFGGLERLVAYFDLDCRFDVLRLSNALKLRIMEAFGPTHDTCLLSYEIPTKSGSSQIGGVFDNELLQSCMRRFLYIRCYNSIEFLAALKTMCYKFQKESEALGINIHFLMIDGVGAFHWTDRASQPLPQCGTKRKSLLLQTLAVTVVQEIRNLSQVQPVLVLATKATIFGSGTSTNNSERFHGKSSSEDMTTSGNSRRDEEKLLYREYMPSMWQSFVTHRIHLGVSDGIFQDKKHGSIPIFTSEWFQPPLHIMDKFIVKDNGIFLLR